MKKFIQWNWHLGLNADYMGNIKNSDISLWLKNWFLSNCGGNICREVEEFIITLTDSSHSSLPIICYEGRTIQADNHQPPTTNQFICITGIGNHFHGCFCMKSAIFPCHHPAVIHQPQFIFATTLQQCVLPIKMRRREKIPFKSDETWNHIIYIIFTFLRDFFISLFGWGWNCHLSWLTEKGHAEGFCLFSKMWIIFSV